MKPRQATGLLFLVALVLGTGPSGTNAATVIGWVRSAINGGPVSHASVWLLNGNGRTTTDRHGRFTLSDVPAGSYTLVVQRPRETTSIPMEVRGAADTETLVVRHETYRPDRKWPRVKNARARLSEPQWSREQLTYGPIPKLSDTTTTLLGWVRESDGTPVVFANVVARPWRHGSASDESGHFLIPGIPAGSCTLRVQIVGRDPQTRLLQVRGAADTETLLFRMKPHRGSYEGPLYMPSPSEKRRRARP